MHTLLRHALAPPLAHRSFHASAARSTAAIQPLRRIANLGDRPNDRELMTPQTAQGDLLYGTHSIEAALTSNSRTTYHAFYAVGTKGEEDVQNDAQEKAIQHRGRLARKAEAFNVPIHWVSRQELNRLLPPGASGSSGGVALDCSPLDNVHSITCASDLDAMCQQAPVDNQCVLFVDEVQDPQNLGSTLRCALFLGTAGVCISGKNSAPLSPSVSRASSGALEILAAQGRLTYSKGPLPTLLKHMKEQDWNIVGTVVNDQRAVPLSKAPTDRSKTRRESGGGGGDVGSTAEGGNKIAIVMGNEGHGMRKMVKRGCTTLVTLPASMGSSSCNSLNVSVTAALVMNHYLQE